MQVALHLPFEGKVAGVNSLIINSSLYSREDVNVVRPTGRCTYGAAPTKPNLELVSMNRIHYSIQDFQLVG